MVATRLKQTIIDIAERETRLFPRSELFDSYGNSKVLPETRALSAFEMQEGRDGFQLRVLGLIGFLPLTTTLTLNIRPKFPISNLWHMLEFADEGYKRILPVLRTYERGTSRPPHLLLAKSFTHFLRKILTNGVVKGYRPQRHEGFFRPKVNFGDTASRYLSRGEDVRIVADVHEFSSRLVSNRLLKSGCLAFLKIIPRTSEWSDDRRLILDALNALDAVRTLAMRPGDEAQANEMPRWVSDSYYGALRVYSMLMGFTTAGFYFDAVGAAMPSFLFSLDDIFESYIRSSFREHLKDQKISVLDGNIERNFGSLFSDTKRYPTKPDLIFRKKKQTFGLAEVKYKAKLAESDRYQLISHVVSAAAPVGIWISPASEQSEGLERVGKIVTGNEFFHYRISLDGDLVASTASMLGAVTSCFKFH